MNWLRDNYKELGMDGLTLLIIILFLAALYLAGMMAGIQ